MQTFMQSVHKFYNFATRIRITAFCILTACLVCRPLVVRADNVQLTYVFGNLNAGTSFMSYPEMMYLDYLQQPSSTSTSYYGKSYSVYRFRIPLYFEYGPYGNSLRSLDGNVNDLSFTVSINTASAGYNGPLTLTPINFYIDGLDDYARITFNDDGFGKPISNYLFVPGEASDRATHTALFEIRSPAVQFHSGRSATFYICLDMAATTGGLGLTDFGDKPVTLSVKSSSGINLSSTIVSNTSISADVSDIKNSIITNRNEDKSDATQAGADATSLVSQMNGLRSKWSILWYPIEFSNRLLNVFSSGSAASVYVNSYDQIMGYRYCEDTGYLVPVYDLSRSSSTRVGQGASITFPSFSILGETVWDSYSFDLTQVKVWFPELFNLLYVAISILELYWFVSFLRDKYEEVFGS